MLNFVAIRKGASATAGTNDELENFQVTTTDTLSKIH